MSDKPSRVRFRVEAFRREEWQEVLGLHRIDKGERFRIFDLDGTVMKEGIALENGYINSKGFGSIHAEYDESCWRDPNPALLPEGCEYP